MGSVLPGIGASVIIILVAIVGLTIAIVKLFNNSDPENNNDIAFHFTGWTAILIFALNVGIYDVKTKGGSKIKGDEVKATLKELIEVVKNNPNKSYKLKYLKGEWNLEVNNE